MRMGCSLLYSAQTDPGNITHLGSPSLTTPSAESLNKDSILWIAFQLADIFLGFLSSISCHRYTEHALNFHAFGSPFPFYIEHSKINVSHAS
jgi:hypothetical protein